jgi:hypothetical protein
MGQISITLRSFTPPSSNHVPTYAVYKYKNQQHSLPSLVSLRICTPALLFTFCVQVPSYKVHDMPFGEYGVVRRGCSRLTRAGMPSGMY